MNYFSKLNYTMANEDSSIEYGVLPEGQEHVVSIAGSGARVIPLLAKQPLRLTVIDRVKEQLYLTELRIQAVKDLSHQEYLHFLGYDLCEPKKRRDLFRKLSLSEGTRAFTESLLEALGYESFLYLGRFEKFMQLSSKILRTMLLGKHLDLSHCKNLEEQRDYFRNEFPWGRFRLFLKIFGNEYFYNLVLYKGHFPKPNLDRSFYQFYMDIYKNLFEKCYIGQNFYLQLLFFGKLQTVEARPIEARADIFGLAKACARKCHISYVQDDVLVYLKRFHEEVDFLSFSNVPSYFKGQIEKSFYQMIGPSLKRDARIVSRAYSHIPFRPITEGYENITPRFNDLLAKEVLPMYFIDVYRRIIGRESVYAAD